MSHRFIRWQLCLGFGLALLLTVTALAQPSPSVAAETVSARFMAWEESVSTLVTVNGGKAGAPVEVPGFRFGPPVSVPGEGGQIRLYAKVQRNGREELALAARAVLPPGAKRVSVALIRKPKADEEGAYQTVVLPDDLAHFPVGALRLFNFTPHPAAFKTGDQNVLLKPLEWKIITPFADKKNRVRLSSALQEANGWQLVSEEILLVPPQYRADAVLVVSKGALAAIEGRPAGGDSSTPRAALLSRAEFVGGSGSRQPL